MIGAVTVDHIYSLPLEEQNKFNIIGQWQVWHIIDFGDGPVDFPVDIELSEYEAYGWKFWQNSHTDNIKVQEDFVAYHQLPKDKLEWYPRKNRVTGEVLPDAPARWKYKFTEEDVKQGQAFGAKMEPLYVQRTFKPQAQ